MFMHSGLLWYNTLACGAPPFDDRAAQSLGLCNICVSNLYLITLISGNERPELY